MHNSKDNLISIKKEIQEINPNSQLIVVTKTFGMSKIEPLIEFGHRHFGENKVQEALEKWESIKATRKDINLHLIGKLQSNKVKFCLPLFDYIHGLDSIKLAEKIANEQVKKNFRRWNWFWMYSSFSDKRETKMCGKRHRYIQKSIKCCKN